MNKLRTALILRVLKSCWERRLGRAIQIQRTLTILWLHHDTMKSVSLYESWSFRTKIAGSDPRIYLGAFLFLWPFVSCLSEVYRGRSIANLEARDEAKKQNTQKNTTVRSNAQGYDLAVAFLLAMRSFTWTFSARSCMARKITPICQGRLHFTICRYLPFWLWHVRPLARVVVSQARHLVFPFGEGLSMNLPQGSRPNCSKVIFNSVCQLTFGQLTCFCLYRSWTEKNETSLCVLGCVLPRFFATNELHI